MADPYESRVISMLREKLHEDLNETHNVLGNGTQILREDAASTGMNCAKLIGQIAGLKLALQRLKDTEEDLTHKPKKKELEKA